MKSWMWVLIALLLVLIIAILFMLKPSTVVAPETTLEPTPVTSKPGAQFLQMEPDFITP